MARKSPSATRLAPAAEKNLGRELFRLLLALCCLFLIGYFFSRAGNFATKRSEQSLLIDFKPATDSNLNLCGLPAQNGRAVIVQMVYSKDKQSWIEFAASRFAALCPNIQVKVTAMEDLEAVSAMLAGEISPALWAPIDDMAIGYLQHRAKSQPDPAKWSITERHSLAQSPLVLLIWQDRLQVLANFLREEPSQEGQWVRSMCAGIPRDPALTGITQEQMVPGSWLDLHAPLLAPAPKKGRGTVPAVRPAGTGVLPGAEEIQKWGRVKIGHAMPTRYLGGLAALYLLSYDYILPPADRSGRMEPDLDVQEEAENHKEPGNPATQAFAAGFTEKKQALQRWLRRCEAGLEPEPRSLAEVTESMFADGPSRHDAVVTYEHLSLPFLDKLDSTAGKLKKMVIVYPKPTLLARHPAVLFSAPPEQQEAARRWLAFLLSKPMQQSAIERGLRPANPEVSIHEYAVVQNRFLHLRRFGILPRPQLQEAPLPEGSQLEKLMELWGQATGRN